MSDLNEFAINLPMGSVPAIMPATEPYPYDVTAGYELPSEIYAGAADHVYVYADVAPRVNQVPGTSMISMDLVLNVNVTNPATNASSTYQIVKRLSMDKCKLAHQAEVLTPFQVVEAEEAPEDELIVEQEMAAYFQRRRVQEMAGIYESNGKKKFKVMFKYDDPSGKGVASGNMTYDAIVDKAHARHVFASKIDKKKYQNAKIIRVTEVE